MGTSTNTRKNTINEQYETLEELSTEEKIALILNSKINIEPSFIDNNVGFLVEFI